MDTPLVPGTRVLDVGALDAGLAQALAQRGVTRYLGLVEPAALPGVEREAGSLSARFHPLTSPDAVLRCSTDLLVLRASHARLLWTVRDLGHVRLIAVERAAAVTRVETLAATLLARAAGRLRPRGAVRLAGRLFDLLEVTHRHAPATRTYFSPVWGTEGLARRLEAAGLQYAVLRWFESLPALEPGEDLDVLVSDEDHAALRALLEEEPGTVPIDLYSVSGLPYSDYHGAAYYPPDLARGLLARAERHTSGFRVPAPPDHLHSLAYHAVYHKGTRSGIESELLGRPVEDSEHDYHAALSELAGRQGVRLPSTLEALDEYLGSVGWRPPADALRRLAPSNDWVRAHQAPVPAPAPDGSELAVFLVREETLTVLGMEDVLGVLDHFGFDVILIHELTGDAMERCAVVIRGGNWGRGPFPRSGGKPAVVVVALHYAPGAPWEEMRTRYPHLTNADTLRVKQRVREKIEDRVDPDQAFNPIHSADNEDEAWEYLATAAPELVDQVRAEVAARRASMDVGTPVRHRLSRGRRARVDVVEGTAGPVVRKTFAKPFLRHMAREVRVMTRLAGVVDAVPPVLESGPNWFVCPYYANTLGDLEPGRLVPLRILREMVAVLRELHERGYDFVDAKPQNFVHDPHAGLKIVDFEFVHEYGDGDRPPFERSLNFGEVPAYFAGDAPVGDKSYETLWLPYTGLSLDALLHASTGRQRLHRALYRVRRTTTGHGSPVRRTLGRARQVTRHARWRASTRYAGWARQRAGMSGAL